MKKFAQGNLEIVRSGYACSYLLVAYRWLMNEPLNQDEQKAVCSLWYYRLGNRYIDQEQITNPWVKAVKQVTGARTEAEIDPYCYLRLPDSFSEYLNCPAPAFLNAANILNERVKRYGTNSEIVKAWLRNQNIVFQNCSCSDKPILPIAIKQSDKLALADYNYQLASVYFYAGNFEKAKETFEAIANDNNSPWHNIAPYLIARVLVREANVKQRGVDLDKLAKAKDYLLSMLNDKKYISYKARRT